MPSWSRARHLLRPTGRRAAAGLPPAAPPTASVYPGVQGVVLRRALDHDRDTARRLVAARRRRWYRLHDDSVQYPFGGEALMGQGRGGHERAGLSENGVRLSLVHPLLHTKLDWH